MMKLIAKTAIAAALALGTLGAAVPAASAAGPGIDFRVTGPSQAQMVDYRRDRDRRWDRCSPVHAVEKARRTGLRRAEVRDIGPRRVVVAGMRHGRFDRMVFANERGCPLLRR